MDHQMNPRIWSLLPDHLLEHVLSYLPLKTFLSLRSTCKHFNSLLSSPRFISKYCSSSSSSASPFSSFIILSHPHFSPKCPIYNTVVNSWNSMSPSRPDPMLTCPPNSTLLSSSNGLLCFSMPRSSCFVVCNLLSRSLRKVKFPTCPFGFELLTLISTPSGFKLFMINSVESSIETLVYSSRSNSWQHFEGFDPTIINSTHDQKGVLHNNSLLFTTPENHLLVGFDLGTGKWEKSMIGLPGQLTFARLASDDDHQRLFLIGGVGESGISRSIKLWELSEDGENWTEIETLPEMVCKKFLSVCYHNYQHVYCFWHQGLICVCCYTWPEVLYYKVSRRTWHWLPKCPSLPAKWSCGFRWFSFKPELCATV